MIVLASDHETLLAQNVITFLAVFSRLADRTSAVVLVDHVDACAACGAPVQLTIVDVLLTVPARVPCRHKIHTQSALLSHKQHSARYQTTVSLMVGCQGGPIYSDYPRWATMTLN